MMRSPYRAEWFRVTIVRTEDAAASGYDSVSWFWLTTTSRSGSATGRLRRTSAWRMVKIAVFAPIPSASVSTTIRANDGRFISERIANLRLCATLPSSFSISRLKIRLKPDPTYLPPPASGLLAPAAYIRERCRVTKLELDADVRRSRVCPCVGKNAASASKPITVAFGNARVMMRFLRAGATDPASVVRS
jgi:hypothetical protein